MLKTDPKQINLISKARNSSIGTALIVVALGGFIYWFIPSISKLDTTSTIKVTRWVKKEGKIIEPVGPLARNWVDIRRVSRNVLNAFVVAEDAKFWNHSGIDFEAIEKSFIKNIKKGYFARGGSTITQQVVKMTLLSRDKSVIRKAREAVGALLLERRLAKKKILEWYINLAEFGDGVYGISEAARHYFQTEPELLTIDEAIHLALVLPSPNGWSKGLRERKLTDFGHKRFSVIATRMLRSGYVTPEQYRNVMATGDFGRNIKGFSATSEEDFESFWGIEEEAALLKSELEETEKDHQGSLEVPQKETTEARPSKVDLNTNESKHPVTQPQMSPAPGADPEPNLEDTSKPDGSVEP